MAWPARLRMPPKRQLHGAPLHTKSNVTHPERQLHPSGAGWPRPPMKRSATAARSGRFTRDEAGPRFCIDLTRWSAIEKKFQWRLVAGTLSPASCRAVVIGRNFTDSGERRHWPKQRRSAPKLDRQVQDQKAAFGFAKVIRPLRVGCRQ
jgi:hypothetical protein